MSINKVILVGRLGADPEVSTTKSGKTMARLSLATNSTYYNEEGRQQSTQWHRLIAWDKVANHCARFLTKGQQIYIEGYLQNSSWQDGQGQRKYMTQVVVKQVQFLGKDKAPNIDQPSNSEYTEEQIEDLNQNFSFGFEEEEAPF